LQNRLEAVGLWSKIDLKQLEDEIEEIINEAVEFAENGTLEPISDLEKFVHSPEVHND